MRQENGKTYRHKRRLEDSTDVFDRRAKSRRKSNGGKHRKSDGQGGKEYKDLLEGFGSRGQEREWRTRSGLYRLFIPAFESLEGFFDKFGNPVVNDPDKVIEGFDGEDIIFGAKTYLKNERQSLKHDPSELNEVTRQFPFTTDEAFRDSIDGSLFNIGKIYEQIQYNDDLYPNPVVRGNFVWKDGVQDTRVVFKPDAKGGSRLLGCHPKI